LNNFAALEEISGNDPIKRYLKRLLEKDEIPGSLLFAGCPSAQKELFAESFARLALKHPFATPHPDFYMFRPEGKLALHSIEAMRQLKEEASLSPFSAERKVFLIFEAERMLPASANALLKIFEEPPPHSIIILVSSFSEKLLPTIFSRCHTLYFKGEEKAELKLNPLLTDFLMARKQLSYSVLVKLAKEMAEKIEEESAILEEKSPIELTAYQEQLFEKQREGKSAICQITRVELLFEQILSWFRDMLLLQFNAPKELLILSEQSHELAQACQRGEFLPLEKVQQAINEAKLALERSTPLHHVLENLFLKLC